nr:NUDIX domain-containing protein [Gordonia oryzae]
MNRRRVCATVPGGKVESGETLEKAVIRGIAEEQALSSRSSGRPGWSTSPIGVDHERRLR